MRPRPPKRLAYGAAKVFAYDGAMSGQTAREVANRHGLNVNSLYHAARQIGVKFKPDPNFRKFFPQNAKTAP